MYIQKNINSIWLNKCLKLLLYYYEVKAFLSGYELIPNDSMTFSRLFFVGAREGHLPEFMAMIHRKRFTPMPAMLFTSSLTLVMLCSNDMWTLINYMSFVQWLSVGMSIAALLYLRKTKPDMHRPIRVSTTLFSHAFLLEVCVNRLQQCVSRVKMWMTNNKLKIKRR